MDLKCRRNRNRRGAGVLVSSIVASALCVADGLKVEVAVEASWPPAPLAAELLEGLAEVGRGKSFLEALVHEADKLPGDDSPEGWTQAVVRAAEAQLSSTGTGSFFGKLLSLRSRASIASARVEAAVQLETCGPSEGVCKDGGPTALLLVNGTLSKVYCSGNLDALPGEALSNMVADAEVASMRPWKLVPTVLDHFLYGKLESAAGPLGIEVLGCAALSTRKAAHKLLKALKDVSKQLQEKQLSGRVVFRHAKDPLETQGSSLAGFGVELQTRSTDEVAKSRDGAAAVSTPGHCSLKNTTENASTDPVESFHGLNLALLASQHPESLDALCNLQEDLKKSVEKPSPPWVLKRLGAHLARRVREIASAGSPLIALDFWEEIAQNYPAGWAQALSSASSEQEAVARQVLEDAETISSNNLVEVNGWRVPENRRNLLSLMQTFTPLARALEQLSSEGFDEPIIAGLLRDTRPRSQLASKIDFGDPRLPDNDGFGVIFDARTDPSLEQKRLAEEREQHPALLRLAQFYGRFWGFPPPLPRAFVGLGFALDPCDRASYDMLTTLLEDSPPFVAWVQWISPSFPKVADRLNALLSPSMAPLPFSPLKLLQEFVAEAGAGQESLCRGGRKRMMQVWDDLWKKAKKTPPTLEPAPRSKVSLPVPSATVNGQIVSGSSALDATALMGLCKKEVETLVMALQRRRGLNFQDDDSAVAEWQYKQDGGYMSDYHPILGFGSTSSSSSAGSSYSPLPSSLVKNLIGKTEASKGTTPAVHVLVLGSLSVEALPGVQAVLDTYSAYLERTSRAGKDTVLKVAVQGACSSEASLSTAIAACLNGIMGEEVAWDALMALAQILGTATNQSDSESLQLLKESCGLSKTLEVATCAAHREVFELVGTVLPDSLTVILNGKKFGPIGLLKKEYVPLEASHITLLEDIEVGGLNPLTGPSKAQFGTKGIMAGLRSALTKGGGKSDEDQILRLSYALSVRSRAAEQVHAIQHGGDDDEDDDDASSTTGRPAVAEQTFQSAPESLKLRLEPIASESAPLQIYAIMDTLSQDAQRLLPLLRSLHLELNAGVAIVLRPVPLVSVPLLSYYRPAPLVAPTEQGLKGLLTWNGRAPNIKFDVPARSHQILSMQLRTPAAWLCSPTEAGDADLDSLSPDSLDFVRAKYVLESLFVEGWAMAPNGRPAAGRHLALAPLFPRASSGSSSQDSVVVKSGYFQLRAPPGLYQLTLRQPEKDDRVIRPRNAVGLLDVAGRSTPLEVTVGRLEEDSAGSSQGDENEVGGSTDIEAADVVEPPVEGAGGDPSKCSETIHIFSVASGHRYERLLRIMIMSVRQHTSCPLRVWLVDNFLSPKFRQVLPTLAAEVGFAVSRMTYKWPSWLRAQSEKQRVIWAYKILFLDVFFPKQVERVLFIDADQIVRSDIRELWTTDLQGAVYGFVPFCSTTKNAGGMFGSWGSAEVDIRNPETTGFRFWEQGFWQRHLSSSGKVYHISALFVVDLVAFRKRAAGDILREVYQQLTEDPHSLANLDQDLPNYVQHQLPIFSLPPEWLWCESWCSEESKARAKTIDMCQNPVKKEGKLQQARRIAPEWTKYDEKLEAIMTKAGFHVAG